MPLSPHFEPGRAGREPRAIVVHTTDGTFDGTLSWFASPRSAVSAHHLVRLDGRLVQVVDEADTAFHSGSESRPEIEVLGDDPPNLVTIGIEFDDGGDPHGVERPHAQYQAGAQLLAGIARRWNIPLDRHHVLAHNLINERKTCPGNLDIDRLLSMAIDLTGSGAPAASPRLVLLLPARNAEADLPGWFDSIELFADAVVALDDGSTDGTAASLEDHPLVEVLLRNPRRDTYEGWDDSANRNRLLAAAATLEPHWILSLDADERIPADDAVALRSFLETDALAGLAYGMQCFRMWGRGCDPEFHWAYRLFAFSEGQRFPDEQLHFDPVPTSIAPPRHIRTSLRIQHWGSSTEEQRVARAAKYREADPDARYPTGHAGLDDAPAQVLPWPDRSEGGPIVLGGRSGSMTEHHRASPPARVHVPSRSVEVATPRPRVVVLLPARNAEADLPGWFDSIEHFADAVVALDDGSTDETAKLLEDHPLVEVLLRNPRRDTYEGWDDSANRNRLLAAAAAVLEPDWILSLDADERIPPDDALALRSFLETDALAGLAYGMQCFRMIDDLTRYDRNSLWVYRLFAYSPGLQFPSSRLHFVPIPTAIPRGRWLRTTIRIQHLSSLTGARRSSRLEKYREADPGFEYQGSYDNLVEEPRELIEFTPRPPDLAVLADRDHRAVHRTVSGPTDVPVDYDPEGPALSAIVISRDDEDRIRRTVRSVVEQECDEPFEVIVVTSGTDRTADIVRSDFPGVRVVELDHPALPGEARNAGLRVASGDYISFPGAHVELAPGSLAARMRAHDRGWTMVTGTTLNGTDTAAGWAAYFLDNSSVLPGRPSEQLGVAPAHCSYDARALFEIGGFPDDVRAGEDTRVNETLFASGFRAFRSAEVGLVHHNRSRNVGHLIRHHFERGRAQVQFIRSTATDGDRDVRVGEFLWAYPTRRLARIDQSVQQWGGGLRSRYRRVRPLVRLGVLAAWVGGHLELHRPLVRSGSDDLDSPRGGSEFRRTSPVSSPLTRPLRVVRRAPAPRQGTRAIFLHIPKTAGSTLFSILEREYEGSPSFRLYGDIDDRVRVLTSMDEARRRALRLVGGHMGFGVDRLLPGASTYITLIRDPVDRIVSHYHYVRSRPHDQGHARALEGVDSLDDYVRSSVFARIVNNGQTRLLGSDISDAGEPAGPTTLATAKRVLDRDDVVVGLQDRFDESVLLMVHTLGWGHPAYGSENRGTGRPRVSDLPDATIGLIRERNALDIELYEHARARFESDLSSIPNLDDELELARLASRYRATSS